jgi:hypothetical protein
MFNFRRDGFSFRFTVSVMGLAAIAMGMAIMLHGGFFYENWHGGMVFAPVFPCGTAVTPEMALRLARLFGNKPEFRLNAQRAVDLWDAERALKKRIRQIKPLTAA